MDWLIGFGCSLAIAGLAYWKKSLSASGAIAAAGVGTVMYALGSLAWFGTLIAFFISSTFWSKWKKKRKASAESGYAKTGRRDAGQVFANGALGAVLCAAYAALPHPFLWGAFIGVMAAVNADTWATEIGGLSRAQPRSIVSGRKVPAGTSGGVTPLGLAASAAGGLFIGAAAWALMRLGASEETPGSLAALLLLGLAGGLAGSLADSLIGATGQVMYRCSSCGKEIEKKSHCGQPAVRIRGLSLCTNDTVNVIGSLVGGAAGLLLTGLL